MSKFPLFCRLFGHKFVMHLYDCSTLSETYRVTPFNKPFCKRCGISQALLVKVIERDLQ